MDAELVQTEHSDPCYLITIALCPNTVTGSHYVKSKNDSIRRLSVALLRLYHGVMGQPAGVHPKYKS